MEICRWPGSLTPGGDCRSEPGAEGWGPVSPSCPLRLAAQQGGPWSASHRRGSSSHFNCSVARQDQAESACLMGEKGPGAWGSEGPREGCGPPGQAPGAGGPLGRPEGSRLCFSRTLFGFTLTLLSVLS